MHSAKGVLTSGSLGKRNQKAPRRYSCFEKAFTNSAWGMDELTKVCSLASCMRRNKIDTATHLPGTKVGLDAPRDVRSTRGI